MAHQTSSEYSICAVIATYNRASLLRRCLVSLCQQNLDGFDIIVVDNASTDGTREMVGAEFPEVHLIRLEKNTGASGGINTGLRFALQSEYEYCWLVDNDCVADPETLERLYRAMEDNPQLALTASTVMVMDGNGEKTSTIHEMGGEIDWLHGRLVSLKNGQLYERSNDDNPLPAGYLAMTSMLLRSSLLEKYGLLREEFFVFGEDIDLSLRYRKLGFEIAAVPASRVWHLQGAHKATSPLREYYAARNYLFLFWEMAPGLLKITSLYLHLARSLSLAAIFKQDGHNDYAKAIWKAVASFFLNDLRPFLPNQNPPSSPNLSPIPNLPTPNVPVPNLPFSNLPKPLPKILIISRSELTSLRDTLQQVRSQFPGSEIHLLFLHYFQENNDLGLYGVAKTFIRPATRSGQINLLWRLLKEKYDLSVPTIPALTFLYESTARYTLMRSEENWRVVKAGFFAKLAGRLLAALAGYGGAALLMLALPLRPVFARLASKRPGSI